MPLSKNYELGTLANTLDIDQSTGEITSLTIDTDVVSEGANLYFTSERVDDRVAALIQAGTNITVAYDDVLGTLTISASDTEDDLSNNTTSDLAEGTNLYYTNARADARIAAASIDALTDVDITTAAQVMVSRWFGIMLIVSLYPEIVLLNQILILHLQLKAQLT